MQKTKSRRRVQRPHNPEVITISRRDWNRLKAGHSVAHSPRKPKKLSHRSIVKVQTVYAPKGEWMLAFVYKRPFVGTYFSRKLLP